MTLDLQENYIVVDDIYYAIDNICSIVFLEFMWEMIVAVMLCFSTMDNICLYTLATTSHILILLLR